MDSPKKRAKHMFLLVLGCVVLILILIGVFPTRVEETHTQSIDPKQTATTATDQ